MLTAETLKDYSKSRESKQTQYYNEYIRTQAATIKNWKTRFSQMIAFTGASVCCDVAVHPGAFLPISEP